VTNILLAIVLDFYLVVKTESKGRWLDDGLLSRVYRIISQLLPKDSARWVIERAEGKLRRTMSGMEIKEVETVPFTRADRERLEKIEMTLEKAIYLLHSQQIQRPQPLQHRITEPPLGLLHNIPERNRRWSSDG